MAAVCETELTAVQELDPICTGDDLLIVVPSPSRPYEPKPQVNNLPSERMAAVWIVPALTAVQELDPICTGELTVTGALFPICTGDDPLVTLPAPNRPKLP